MNKIRNAGFFSLDTETTSLNEREADLVGLSVSIEVGKAFYIPVGHKKSLEDLDESTLFSDLSLDERQLSIDTVITVFKPILEDPSILKIGQNIKYDSKIFTGYFNLKFFFFILLRN